MKFLCIEKELNIPKSKIPPDVMEAEALKVYDLYVTGVLREIYFKEENNIGILILECKDKKEAEAVIAELPIVRKGYIGFDIIGLRPYPGFNRLFDNKYKSN